MKINYKLILIILLILIWWSSKSDAQVKTLTIESAVKLSLEKNRELQVAKLETDKSSERLKEAQGSALPTINLSGQYLHFFQKPVSFLPGSFIGLGENQLAPIRVGGENAIIGALNITQPIFVPTIAYGIRASRINEQITDKALIEVKSRVTTVVKKAYLDVLILQEQLLLQNQSIERNKLALKDARSLLAQGRASRIDTLRAFVIIENLKSEVIRLTNGVEIAKTNLKRTIGLDEKEEIELLDSISNNQFIDQISEDAFLEAIKSRPEIQRLQLTEELSKEYINIELSERLPNLSLIGSLQTQAQSNNFEVNRYDWPVSSYVGLQLNVPILEGFRKGAQVRQAKITRLQTEKQLNDFKEIVRSEVKVSLSRVEESLKRIDVQKQTVSVAEVGYRITNDRWKQGISSRLELSDAELSLAQSKSNYLQAIYDYLVASIELERVLGRVSN